MAKDVCDREVHEKEIGSLCLPSEARDLIIDAVYLLSRYVKVGTIRHLEALKPDIKALVRQRFSKDTEDYNI